MFTYPENEYQNIIIVTNRQICHRPFLEQLRLLCALHPAGIILREKDLSEEAYLELASQVQILCTEFHVPLILHSYETVCRKLEIRNLMISMKQLGTCKDFVSYGTLGVSVHSKEEAQMAWQAGADYLVAGHIFETDCKKGLPGRGLEFLKEICNEVELPVYAIGGIHPKEMKLAMQAGASKVCIMSDAMHY